MASGTNRVPDSFVRIVLVLQRGAHLLAMTLCIPGWSAFGVRGTEAAEAVQFSSINPQRSQNQ